MAGPHVVSDLSLIAACANVWAHLAGSDDPELIALANECHEALTEIERLTKELKRVKALCARMADQGVYSDSYGVHGSDFQCCKCCTAGGSPGVLFEHDAECPVGRSEEIVDEWFSEMKENADEIDRFRREKAELVEAAGRLLNPEFQDNVEEEINRQHQGDCTIIEAVTIAFELSGMSAAIRKITAGGMEG